ncbi:Fic family protein [Streptomyces sp. NPDC050485]|uniref:Fic family protein n=1 Tax=Streptomyces sp. NPDC050485 TaxID=3365617 RepID=UPI0037A83A04
MADLMDGEREGVDASEENKTETLAYQQSMTCIQSLHDVEDFRYNKELLNALHWMLQGHHHPLKAAGQWRKTSIRITAPGDELATDYEGPDQDLVPGLMGEFVDWLNDGDLDHHVLIRAAMAHLNLWSPERDTLPWIKFSLLAYHQQAQRVQFRVDRSNGCWMHLMDAKDELGLSERQMTALHEVAMTGQVRRSRYERAEAINTQQATRDLQALTKAQVLTAVGQTKGRHYTAGPRFPQDVLATARRPHTIVDPYAA